MTRAIIPALALALIAAPVAAQDSRLVEVMYDEAKVVRIDGRVSVQASIMFNDDEVIENVAIGDSATWQVTPRLDQSHGRDEQTNLSFRSCCHA